MISLIDATFKKVRWISTVLRPRWLDDLGLSDSIKWLIEEFQEMTEIQCELSMSRSLNLDKQLSTAIYRIFQEALTNIFRHSKATRVQISLKKQGNQIVLSIADNGIGISSKRMSKTKSFGILGMRERAQSLGGIFEITGARNKGTSIKASFPI
jgi:signal transduction histidine kinase